MSWDDIDVKASDVIGIKEPEHPVQMIMSADEIIKVPLMKFVRCNHGIGRLPVVPTPKLDYVIQEEKIVTMHMCGFDMDRIHTVWAMGLCDCGKLYWCEVKWTFFDR